MKPGKDFERVMFIIEKTLADKENITVEPNKKLRDKDTGGLVEFDVIETSAKPLALTGLNECNCRERFTSHGGGDDRQGEQTGRFGGVGH